MRIGIAALQLNHAGEGGLYAELIQDRSFDALAYTSGFNSSGPVTEELTRQRLDMAGQPMERTQALRQEFMAVDVTATSEEPALASRKCALTPPHRRISDQGPHSNTPYSASFLSNMLCKSDLSMQGRIRKSICKQPMLKRAV